MPPFSLVLSRSASTAAVSMPGAGRNDPKRYSIKMNSVKRILLRSSGTRNMLVIRENTLLP